MAPANPFSITTTFNLYKSYVFPSLPEPVQQLSSTLEPYFLSALPYLQRGSTFFSLFNINKLTNLAGSAASSGDYLSLFVLLVSMYFGLRVVNYMRRSIMSWVFFAVKALMVLVLVQVGFYVQRNGWEKTVGDAGWLGDLIWQLVPEGTADANTNARTRQAGSRAYPTKKRSSWL